MDENLSDDRADENVSKEKDSKVVDFGVAQDEDKQRGNAQYENSQGKDTSGPNRDGAEEASSERDAAEAEKKTPLSVIIAGVVLTVLVIICLQVDDWSRDWTTNYAETHPEAKDVNLRPIESERTVTELCDLVVNTMKDATRWEVISKKQVAPTLIEIKLVHKTFLMGFKDDVTVEIVAKGQGAILYVESQSRIGKGDLGQNPRNIKELVGLIRAAMTKQETTNANQSGRDESGRDESGKDQ